MFFGDDEDVGGGLRVDVFEGEDVVVFVNFFGGDFSAENAAEEAVWIGHFLFTQGFVWKTIALGRRGCQLRGSGPQRLDPRILCGLYRTTEVVPFPVAVV